jgi:hypothetical protein
MKPRARSRSWFSTNEKRADKINWMELTERTRNQGDREGPAYSTRNQETSNKQQAIETTSSNEINSSAVLIRFYIQQYSAIIEYN